MGGTGHDGSSATRCFDRRRCGRDRQYDLDKSPRALAQQAGSMGASEWDYRSLKEIVEALQARKISALELADHTIARVEALDRRLNAVVVRDFERAREAAKAADVALTRGETAAAARRSDHGQGILQFRRNADDLGRPAIQGLHAERRRRRSCRG